MRRARWFRERDSLLSGWPISFIWESSAPSRWALAGTRRSGLGISLWLARRRVHRFLEKGAAEQFRKLDLAMRFAVGLVLLVPLAYDAGWIDTYLCHVLYSSHAPLGWIRTADGRRELIDTRPELKVPVPQIERFYAAYFAAVAHPGDELENL